MNHKALKRRKNLTICSIPEQTPPESLICGHSGFVHASGGGYVGLKQLISATNAWQGHKCAQNLGFTINHLHQIGTGPDSTEIAESCKTICA
jgi:hypothetical protein